MADADTRTSDLIRVAEHQLATALANTREQIRHARGEERETLRRLRDALNQRLDALIMVHLEEIDRDPETVTTVAALSELVSSVERAAGEMRTVGNAIRKAAEIAGYADQVLRLVGKALM